MTAGWPGALSARELIRRLQHAPGYTVVVEVDNYESLALLDVEYDDGLQIVRIKARKDYT